MLCVVATLKVQDGKGEAFEDVFRRLMAKVRENEPGNLCYQLGRSRGEANTYKVLEIYKDDEAVAAHRGAEHFRQLGREMGAFMAGPPNVEVLDGVE